MQPYIAAIEITTDCNFRCAHCSVYKTKTYLSFSDFKKCVSRLKKQGILFFRLTGGEPLLHPDLFKMISYLRKQKLGFGLNTNGFLLNHNLLLKLKKNNISGIRISVDGQFETHTKIRQNKMSFSKITSLINELNKDKIPFSVNCCLMRDNYLELDKILEQAINNGIQNISFNLIKSESSKGNCSEYIDLFKIKDDKKFNEMIKRFKNINKTEKNITLNAFLNYALIGKKAKDVTFICGAGRESIYVDVFGNVYACKYFSPLYNIFDLKNNNGRNFDNFSKKCSSCKHRDICLMSCPAYLKTYLEYEKNDSKINCPYFC